MTYPPRTVQTSDNRVNVLQLTDTHLHLDIDTEVGGHSCHEKFKHCLNQALNEDIRCDLILLTGDLVNEVHPDIYDRIFAILDETTIPYACIAGNHDVTDEVGAHLPFMKRALVPHSPDPRLLTCHSIDANDWKILLLDSSIPGEVSGEIKSHSLDWLHQMLETTTSPVLIVLHHHVTPIGSKWLDHHMTVDTEQFWSIIKQYPQVKAITTGHVHQQQDIIYNGVNVYSTPSTCFQFMPNQDNFALDTEARSGYRWLQLRENCEIVSWVNRMLF